MTIPTSTTCSTCNITFSTRNAYNRHRKACFIQHEKDLIKLVPVDNASMDVDEYIEDIDDNHTALIERMQALDTQVNESSEDIESDESETEDNCINFPSEVLDEIERAMENDNFNHYFDLIELYKQSIDNPPRIIEYKRSSQWTYMECFSVKLFKTAVLSNVSQKAYNDIVKIFNEFLKVVQS
ncbi:hypothetical protein EC973_006307, partial [Apophysomyces ossiformis]